MRYSKEHKQETHARIVKKASVRLREKGAHGIGVADLMKLLKFDAKELRVIVQKHHLDPANLLKGKGTKKVLATHILEASRKRAERDAKLFEY